MNLKGLEREVIVAYAGYYPGIYLVGLKKTMNNLRILDNWA
jgi:hypothetical protein